MGPSGHFVGESLTLADVAMFESLHKLSCAAPGCLAPFPSLERFVFDIATSPRVSAYLASARRMPLTPNETGKAPHAGLPGYAFSEALKPAAYASEWTPPGR